MHQLITHLQPYMNYKCLVKKLGTLLYPCNTDVLKCLSLALHDSNADITTEDLATKEHNPAVLIIQAGSLVNDLQHDEMKKKEDQSMDLTSFNLTDGIANINSLLWDFVCLRTRSVRERTRKSDEHRTKTVRRFAIISLMLMTTNSS